MFTGIITDMGEVLSLTQRGDVAARIATAYDVAGIEIGASIASDGVCLTVIATGESPRPWYEVEISAETFSATTLGSWRAGRTVNLERALKVGDELGGHIVSGHVDGVAEILSATPEGDSTRFTFLAPPALGRYIAPKGSIALNGTSLTVNEVEDTPEGTRFGVNIIPHTRAVTTWGRLGAGDRVNVEIDTLARYVARLRDWA